MPGQQESFEAELSDALSRGPAYVLLVRGRATFVASAGLRVFLYIVQSLVATG
ncbi:hypothetical protein [Dinoroseobacter sp. S375]|uniref:hypothetical protein n=1 Tax=Dinoroseobacter sp. S375 TaxID=3415136 RepID=UPI003C798C0C